MRRVGAAVVALTATVALVACADDAPQSAPTVLGVTAQRCSSPTRGRGLATVVDADLVVTAGHIVENVREVEVDGRPATVVALDRRSDLALLGVELPDDAVPAGLAGGVPDEAVLETPEGATVVDIDRHVIQVVDHATDRATYRRDVVAFAPAVPRGTSGAPLLDTTGRLVGVVVATLADDPSRPGETYAVTSAEVRALLDARASGSSPGPDDECADSARSPA